MNDATQLETEARALAARFSELLRDEIGAANLAKAREINALAPDAPWCASHDFCDANMIMAEAFADALGYDVDPHDDNDLTAWNRAWTIARRNGFEAEVSA